MQEVIKYKEIKEPKDVRKLWDSIDVKPTTLFDAFELGFVYVDIYFHRYRWKMEKQHNKLFTLPSLRGGSLSRTRSMLIVRKEADYGKDKLIDEIKWINKLPSDIKGHFATIKNYDLKSNPVYYEMEFYGLPSIRKLIMEGYIDHKVALKILKKILDFMFSKVYTKKVKNAYCRYPAKVHLNKIKYRLNETMNKSDIFKNIIPKDYIINGIKIPNIFDMIDEIENDDRLLGKLQPENITMVHGDLHFDNILVKLSEDFELENFILLDPRGKDVYNYTYDLGKLYHSFYGYYDFFHNKMYDLNFKIKNKVNYKINDCKALEEFKLIEKGFEDLIKKQPILDKHWKLRTMFANACHFCSMIPFHLNDERTATAIYFRGLELLNEFIQNENN